jgi:hypothetical protein
MNVAVGRKLQTWAGWIAFPPGNHCAERRPIHTRQRINATHCFFVEINNLLRCFSVVHSRNIDSENALRVQACLRPLQCDERRNQYTCADQQHERSGDLCHREDLLAAVRAAGDAHSPAGKAQLDDADDGRRGTNARIFKSRSRAAKKPVGQFSITCVKS